MAKKDKKTPKKETSPNIEIGNLSENIPVFDDVRKIQVVQGDKNSLNISPVHTHLNIEKPKMNKKKGIIIPRDKK